MTRRTISKQERARAWLGAIGAFAAAAAFGVLVAAALSAASPRVRTPLQNPFDASRSIQ